MEEKLYGLYSVVSKKTIRKKESYFKKFKGAKDVPGVMVKTNRGYFIDGHEVDKKSTDLWFSLVKSKKNK